MGRRDGLAAWLIVAVVPFISDVQDRNPGNADIGRELARSSIRSGKSFDYASELAAMGPRLTGSAAYQRAAEWCVDRFRAMGITRTALEPFTIDRGWERVSARARIVEPESRALHVESLGWTPSTPDGGVNAEIVALESYSLNVTSVKRSLQGRIALLPDGDPPGDPDAAARSLGASLRNAGALAVLVPDGDVDNQLTARGFGFGTVIGELPAAQIGRDDAQAIRDRLRRGPVRLSLEIVNRVTPGAVTVNNVIADIPGRDRPDERVLVGAHLDSWDFGTGAQDNATGVAMVVEAARAIAALEEPPRRSIRFVLWGGEEQGQLGSTAFVRTHASELDRVVAYLNSDAGTGKLIGWTSPGRDEVVRGVRALTGNVLDELGAGTFDQSLRYAFQSDGAPFVLAGIPILDLNADDTKYEDIHHKAADTIERVDARQLAAGAATLAATALAIADAPTRVAPRLDPRSVERLRKK
ncbi:MAG TPA: M20/M25/M40 family metallo-hydrolase [Gemmatimonadaceae bacterium]|nr:M20/M25/M40 family metallo-hydrolase [Gemmatimonadaceae bacterium]